MFLSKVTPQGSSMKKNCQLTLSSAVLLFGCTCQVLLRVYFGFFLVFAISPSIAFGNELYQRGPGQDFTPLGLEKAVENTMQRLLKENNSTLLQRRTMHSYRVDTPPFLIAELADLETPSQSGDKAIKTVEGQNKNDAREETLIGQVREQGTVEAMTLYSGEYPEGRYSVEVQERLQTALWAAVQRAVEAQPSEVGTRVRAYLGAFPTGEHSAEATDLAREETLIGQVREQGTVEVMTLYLGEYPEGRYSVEVQERLQTALWAAVQRAVEAQPSEVGTRVRAYLGAFPTGEHSAEATDLAREETLIGQVREQGTVEAMTLYLGEYPEGRYSVEVQERLQTALWAAVQRAVEAQPSEVGTRVRAYLGAFPTGEHSVEATDLAREETLIGQVREQGTVEAMTLYLGEYPEGRYSVEVQERLQTALWAAVQRAVEAQPSEVGTRVRAYLGAFPTGEHSVEATDLAREETLIGQVREQGTVEAMTLYLGEYPEGRYSVEVQERLQTALWAAVQRAVEAQPSEVGTRVRAYLGAFPTGEHSVEATDLAREETLIGQVREQGTVEVMTLYLGEYPEGRYSVEVQERLGPLLWVEIRAIKDEGDETELEELLEKYLRLLPNGPHVKESEILLVQQKLIKRIRKSKKKNDMVQYLQQFPKRRYAKEVKKYLDVELREGIRKANVEKVLTAYLNEYLKYFPDNKYASKLRNDQSAFEDAKASDTRDAYFQLGKQNSKNVYKQIASLRTELAYWNGRKKDAHTLTQIAEVYQINRGNYDRAIEHFKAALERDKNHYQAYIGLGKLFLEKGDHKKAMQSFKKADITSGGQAYEPFFYLGRFYQTSKPQKALKAYSKAIQINKACEPCYYYRAQTYLVIPMRPAALKDFRTVCKLQNNKAQSRSSFSKLAKTYIGKIIGKDHEGC